MEKIKPANFSQSYRTMVQSDISILWDCGNPWNRRDRGCRQGATATLECGPPEQIRVESPSSRRWGDEERKPVMLCWWWSLCCELCDRLKRLPEAWRPGRSTLLFSSLRAAWLLLLACLFLRRWIKNIALQYDPKIPECNTS
ncbi:uncharacterized [Tachysurus ichikawai]